LIIFPVNPLDTELTVVWLGPSFGMVLGTFDSLFDFVVGGSILPVANRYPRRDPVQEEPPTDNLARSEFDSQEAAELKDLLKEVSKFNQGPVPERIKTKAEQFTDNVNARKAAGGGDRASGHEAGGTRRRERSPSRASSPTSSGPPHKRRPSRLK